MRFRHTLTLAILILIVAASAGCAGRQGEPGPVGPAGPAGPLGPIGPAGDDATASQSYVGAERCGACHEEQMARFVLTGHANALMPVIDGQPPVYPYDDATQGISEPPAGHGWEDISYVVGGFGWMARFVDQDGYVITGDGAQYNFANDDLETRARWVALAGDAPTPFTCATCHTTGYVARGHQGNREGIDGTWAFDGVQCERCHGPGSRHADDPQGVRMVVDRSAQACGDCHVRGDRATMEAANGFAEHNQQFSDLYNSRHFALDCVTCHDPHASARFADPAVNVHRGISQVCENCHWQQDLVRKVGKHLGVDCIDCHMPRMAQSAEADLATFTGDIRSHQFAINTRADAAQFNADGTQVRPYLTLTYVCGQCHNGDAAAVQEPALLEAAADGYHTRVRPTPTPLPEAEPADGSAEATPEP